MRRFGIEVEFVGPAQTVRDALCDAGLSDLRREHSYMGHSDDLWVVKNDASVHGGGEMVSPPLDFDNEDHRAQVSKALGVLRAAGCRTDVSAGIHVHVETADLTPTQLAAVVRVYTKFEDVIYRVASSGWSEMRPRGMEHYCRPLSYATVQKIAKARTLEKVMEAWYGTDRWSTPERLARDHNNATRTHGLNLHSHFYRGTIEFRVFNSSLNDERVQGYIAMCVALVQDARNGKNRSINKRYALGGMASGDTVPSAAYHRFLQVLRYDAGMSGEDMKRLNMIWRDSVPQVPATSTY